MDTKSIFVPCLHFMSYLFPSYVGILIRLYIYFSILKVGIKFVASPGLLLVLDFNRRLFLVENISRIMMHIGTYECVNSFC